MLCNARKVVYVHGILYYVGMVVLGRGQHFHILVYILYPSTRIAIISYSIYDIWAQGGKAFCALFLLLPPTHPTKEHVNKNTRDRVLSQVHSSKP